ncbi:Piwi-domain-containing protein [Ramaria rubella]|nr:Piwi-domain-containing protein [Ramaria rubella]
MSHHTGVRRGRPPGSSQFGRPIFVKTNSFPITSTPTALFFHYNVEFAEVSGRRLALEIIDKLQMQYASMFSPRAAYDGKKNMFRSQPLDLSNNAGTFVVYLGGNSEDARRRGARGVSVKITQVARIDPSSILPLLRGEGALDSQSLTALTLLNVLIRMQPILTHPSNSRSFFTKDTLGQGLELWRGYFQSVRLSMDRLTVNVDISTAVMYQSGPLIDLIKSFLGTRDNVNLVANRIPDRLFHKLERFLKGLAVYSVVPKLPQGKVPKLRRIRSIIRTGADDYTFDKQTGEGASNGEELTITEHFRRAHRDIVYPLEVLHVREGQFYKRILPPALAAQALKFSTQKPHDRLNAIEKSGKFMGYRDSDFLRHSGLVVDDREAMIVAGRVLIPPNILYGGPSGPPEAGSPHSKVWRVEYATETSDKSDDHSSVTYYINTPNLSLIIFSSTKGCNFQISNQPLSGAIPRESTNISERHVAIRKQLDRAVEEAQHIFSAPTVFILAILPDSALEIITAVKHWGDCDRGYTTQCVRISKVKRANNQYCNNLALKINIRVGGVNWHPHAAIPAVKWVMQAPTMIVGADVSHSAPDSDRPSLAGLVSSVDEFMCRYVSSTRVQESRVEIIQDIEAMVTNACNKFSEYQKISGRGSMFPRRVVFYRDGVSEGQFDQVAQEEIKAIKRVFRELKMQAQLVFIIVGKNHHVRFFPQPADADKSGNCHAGLVVDQNIVHPIEYDFYLQSHAGLLGTSRSAHYTVIDDEVKMEADLLQQLSYTLCHVYGRATRSVSIPAPVYYADLVCARGKYHSRLLRDGEDGSTDTGQGVSFEDHSEEFKPIHPNLVNTMYWI